MKGRHRVVHYALLFDQHEVIYAEKTPTESFRPGPDALSSFSSAHRAQVFQIYPGLADNPEEALGPPVRPIIGKGFIDNLKENLKLRLIDQ